MVVSEPALVLRLFWSLTVLPILFGLRIFCNWAGTRWCMVWCWCCGIFILWGTGSNSEGTAIYWTCWWFTGKWSMHWFWFPGNWLFLIRMSFITMYRQCQNNYKCLAVNFQKICPTTIGTFPLHQSESEILNSNPLCLLLNSIYYFVPFFRRFSKECMCWLVSRTYPSFFLHLFFLIAVRYCINGE